MQFPLELSCQIDLPAQSVVRQITLYRGLTTLVGPNGSGKTQILRSLKPALLQYASGRAVRFLPAGRLAHLEAYRSDVQGYYGTPQYENATFGGKDQRQRRHMIEGMLDSFHALGARPDLQIKVAERLRRLFRRDLIIDWDAGNLKVNFARLDSNSGQYSSAREASGLLQLVVLLAELYDDEVGVLLIDEPEVSLHPQLQAFLLREIHRVAGNPEERGKKLVLMATHSTEMIDVRRPEDLASIVFCYDINNAPKQIAPDAGELQGKQLRTLLAHMGQEHKLTFFSDRPVLLEGPSDLIVCTGIDRSLDLYLEAAGAQLLPVIGKGQFPVVSKLMRLIGKSPIIVADADAVADNLDLVNSYANLASANVAAVNKGFRSVGDLASSVYGDFCQLVESNWSDIAALAMGHPYWRNRDLKKDEAISKRRAALATLLPMQDGQLNNLSNSTSWKTMHRRLTALLDVLESAGCFILRKGTIESYYQFAGTQAPEGKPALAVQEVDGFSQEGPEFVETNYADLVRALKFASKTQPISEAKAVRDLLLAVAAPAFGNLSPTVTANELNVLAISVVGEKASIVKMSLDNGVDGAPDLLIDLNSDVLEVPGFPIRLKKGSDPIVQIDRQLGIENEAL